MLVWATEFPAAPGMSPDDLLQVAKEWLIGSQYSEWTEGHFKEEPVGELTKYEAGAQTVVFGRAAVDDQRWAGLSHVWVEKGEREWNTEIVAYHGEESVWLSIRVDCTLLQPGLKLPKPKKPYFVKLLLSRFGAGYDGMFPVDDAPVDLAEDEVDIAAGVIRGTSRNRLPVVYVSAESVGKYTVDVARISKWLSGMAHVLVEPSRYFSFALSRNVGGDNAYGGAVSIYWPKGIAPQIRLLAPRFNSQHDLESAIIEAVRVALTHIRPQPEVTWPFLREVVSRTRIDALRAAGSTRVDEFVEEFDAELQAKQERLESAEREIARLKSENRRYEGIAAQNSDGFLARGQEREYYPGEFRDAIVKTLNAGRPYLSPDSRPLHIVDDLLAVNSISDYQTGVAEELKLVLSKMSKFGHDERKVLEALGCIIIESGKHVKAVFNGDERYTFAISKTGSDHRAGKNLTSVITRKLFG